MNDRVNNGGIYGDKIRANLAVVATSSIAKGKGVSNYERNCSDEVNLRVSHPSIAEEIRSLTTEGSGALSKFILILGELNKMKDMELKKITNRLEIKPIKLNPNWSGQRVGALT